MVLKVEADTLFRRQLTVKTNTETYLRLVNTFELFRTNAKLSLREMTKSLAKTGFRKATVERPWNRSGYKLHLTFTALGTECSVPQEGASVAPNRIDSSTSV